MGKPTSELRFDLVSKDWVVIATGRGKRPHDFNKEGRIKSEAPKDKCPFCNLETQEKPLIRVPDNDQWKVVSVPNKFPAFSESGNLEERAEGPYSLMDGVGFHEVVVTRDHDRQMALMSAGEIREIIDVYQSRYYDLSKAKFVNYVSVFHNHGKEAGASVAHPHSQIIAIPITDPDITGSLRGSKLYFEQHQECVHCSMISWELEDKKRVIFENEKFVVLCPFASKSAFETRIYPKEHQAYFEKIGEEDKIFFAEAMRQALSKIFKGLNDPAYNFFFHTAPCDKGDYGHYHWHLEILPKTSIWAGFELGAGIEISTIEPERAAEYLREITDS